MLRTLWVVVTVFLMELLCKRACGQKPVCGHPGAPANGNFAPIGATFTADTVVKYKCESGFVTAGSDQRSCRRNGTWSGEIPLCTDKNIALGRVATQSSVYRQQRASLAVDGLDMSCAATPRTPAERWWQLNLGKTINVSLVSVTMLAGAAQDFSVYIVNTQGGDSQIVYSRCGNYSGLFRTKSIEIRCKNGSGLAGEYVFIRDNRQGAFSLNLCEVAVYSVKENRTCGQPERPINSIVKPINQTTVRYSCQEGFSLVGSQLLHCIDGVWESPPPYCSETFCPAPPAVPHSKWSATYAEWFPPQDKSHFPFGTMMVYTCHPDYIQDINGSVVCTSNGSWAGIQPRCLPTSCDPLPVILNATIHFPNNTSPTQIGAQAEVRCEPGFHLSNHEQTANIQCFINGSWTDNRIICQLISEDENLQPTLGAILGVITVLILTAVVVVVLVYLRQKGYFKRSNLWPHQNLQSSPRSSGHQLAEAMDESQSKPIGFDDSFNNDQDMLYDDVWPSEEAISKDDATAVTSDGLYADATSSREDLERISGGNANFETIELNDVCVDDGQRIYDQPNDLDDVIEIESVYYSPIETLTQETTADSIDRSQLPPADGAADNSNHHHHRKNSESGFDDDHIYEPLRRPVSPSANITRTRPVYAKVDVMNKKFRRSLEEDEMAGNSIELRQPPEGVTYTTPVFANNKVAPESCSRDSTSAAVGSQRPLPPIPNPPGSRCSVMIDNALYVKGV